MGQPENDASIEIFKSAVSAGENSLKTVVLINGGAAIALLTFIGNKPTSDVDVEKLLFSMILFSVGTFLGGLASCLHYQDRLFRNKKYWKNEDGENLWDKWCDICVGLSYVLFVIGFSFAIWAFCKLVSPSSETQNISNMSIFLGEIEMTDKQIFQIFGLMYLTVGLGILLNPRYYKQMFMDFKTSVAVMYLGGIFAFAIGFLLITFHNIWVKDVSVIITIVGWMALIKGFLIIAAPKLIMKAVDIFTNVRTSTLSTMAVFVTLLGVLFIWLGFFAV